MHSVVSNAVKKTKRDAQPIRPEMVVDVDDRDPLGDELELEACRLLVVGQPQVYCQQQRDKAEAHSHSLDGPLLLTGDEQHEEYRQQREKGDYGEQIFHL